MTYLAYRPDRLATLSVRMRRAADELRTLRCHDPAADEVMNSLRRTATMLDEQWLPVIDRVLRADPLRAPSRPDRDLAALQHSLARVAAVELGWAVAADPTADDPRHTTAAEVHALTRRLAELDPDEVLDDPDTLAWLTDEARAITRDPALAAQFLTEFDDWGRWGNAIACRRAMIAAHLDPGDLVALDDVVSALARVHHVVPSPRLDWLDEMSPYAAALFVRHLDLPARRMAAVVDTLLQLPADELDDLRGPNTADILLGALLRDPVACTRYLELAVRHPATFIDTLADPAIAARLLRVGTDPATTDVTSAGRIVPALLAWYADDPTREPGTLLADLVSPWTLQFSPGNHDWSVIASERNRLIRFALRGDGLQRFIDNRELVVASAQEQLAARVSRPVDELSGWVGLIGELVVSEKVRRVEQRRKAWDFVCNVASTAASFLKGTAVGIVLTVAVVVIHDHWGPKPDDAEFTAIWGNDAALTQTAALIADHIYSVWVTSQLLPEDYPPPPDIDLTAEMPSEMWMGSLWDWLEVLPGGYGGALSNEMRLAVYTVLNPNTMGAHTAHV